MAQLQFRAEQTTPVFSVYLTFKDEMEPQTVDQLETLDQQDIAVLRS